MADYGKMSKAELFKKYGPFIKENYGKEELDFVKDFSTGPGGLDSLRSYIISLDPEPVKKYAGGLISNKKYANPVKIVDNRKKKK
tara:strand:+ start:72 stop:326 length:255 start_codon:yes stop_codon:yes gene_type:complete